MKKILLALFVMALGISLTGVAYAAHGGAGHAGSALGVTTVMDDSCAVSVPVSPSITFSGYIGTNNVDANGIVDVRCTDGTSYTIGLGAGGNYNNPISTVRGMTDNASPTPHYIPYELYKSTTYQVGNELGDDGATHPATSTASIVADGDWQPTTVYGRLWSYTPVAPAGTYSDSVVVTVSY